MAGLCLSVNKAVGTGSGARGLGRGMYEGGVAQSSESQPESHRDYCARVNTKRVWDCWSVSVRVSPFTFVVKTSAWEPETCIV